MLTVKQLKQRKIFEISLPESQIYKKWQTSVIIREISDSNLETRRNGSKSGVSWTFPGELTALGHPWGVKKVSVSQAGRLQEQLNSLSIDELGNWCLKSQRGRARGNSGAAGRSPWQPGKREPPQQQPLTGTVTLKLVQWKYLPNPILTSEIKKPSGKGG